MMINLYKEKGETPLERMRRFSLASPEYNNQPMTYAGRLDPMAEGVLLVLTGEDVHKKETYSALTKEYTFEVLFGVETDSYDILGKISKVSETHSIVSEDKIKEFLGMYRGMIDQEYPPYSSKPVEGKPLWQWAREGKITEITVPKHSVEIFGSLLMSIRTLPPNEIIVKILNDLSKISGDFRQEEITKGWKDFFGKRSERTCMTALIETRCGSGTYVRSIVHELGKFLSIGATTLHIVRTKVGNYSINDSIRS